MFGKKLNVPKEVAQRFVPMVIQDVYELAQDNPKLLPLATLGLFGFGLQTYGGETKKPSKESKIMTRVGVKR